MNPARDFVPLAPAAPATKPSADGKVTLIQQGANAKPFRPLGQEPPGAAAAHAPSCEPRVTVARDGDRVTSIQVHCTCGQVIELACVY